MLSVKQGGIKYHFLSLWYVSTWDWTLVSQTLGKHLLGQLYHEAQILFLVSLCYFLIAYVIKV